MDIGSHDSCLEDGRIHWLAGELKNYRLIFTQASVGWRTDAFSGRVYLDFSARPTCSQYKEIIMQIQLNTDHNIEGHEAMVAHVSSVVESALSQLSDHITRVEVHLSDENGTTKDHKSGQNEKGKNDKRCMMEARLESYHPLAVTAHADTVHQAIDDAADKLARLVESTLGRLHDHKHRRDALTQPEETPPEPT